jgi:hypothetical protein
MTHKRRTEITIETHEITVIRTNHKPLSAFCERCQKTVPVFAPEQIAIFFRLPLSEVCRRVEANEIHLTRSGRGAALICAVSLEGKQIINHKQSA